MNWCFWTVVLEKTLENPLNCKEIKPGKRKSVLNIHWKDRYWSWNSNTLATWCEELTPWKRPWCWERLKAGGEGDGRGWDSWMATNSMDMSLSKLLEILKDRDAWCAVIHGVTNSPTHLAIEQQQQTHNILDNLTLAARITWEQPWLKIRRLEPVDKTLFFFHSVPECRAEFPSPSMWSLAFLFCKVRKQYLFIHSQIHIKCLSSEGW